MSLSSSIIHTRSPLLPASKSQDLEIVRMTSLEKPSSGWSTRPAKILFLVTLMALPVLLLIADWRSRSLASSIPEKLFLSSPATMLNQSVSEIKIGGDSSCLSRWQQDLFREPLNLHSPPTLTAAFDEYEKMHSFCYHRRDLSQAITMPDVKEPCKYIVFLQDGNFGLGNHILSLLSAFVYAMLTNRTLLVDSRGHLPKLFCEPFKNSSWLLPGDFPYNRLLQAPFLMLLSEQTEEQKQFFCPQTQALLEKVTWIGWSSNQYYIPRFFTFPQYWRSLTALFPDVSATFTHLSRYLATPGRKLGVQIRMRGQRLEFDVPTYNRVMECLIENRLLPDISKAGPPHRLNKLTEKAHSQKLQNTTKAFVTSLQGKFYEKLKKTYMNQPTVDGSLVQVHTMSHDEVESQSYEQVVNALAEIWLLSFSDVLVTSSWSTFGYIAQGLAGTRPYILNIKGAFEESGLPPCTYGQSAEPCNQFPFTSVCKANETEESEHSKWMKEHILSCQDEPGGIQLVNN